MAVLLCRYLPIKYNCLAATTFPLSSHRVVIEWSSHLHQPISFSYVIGLLTAPYKHNIDIKYDILLKCKHQWQWDYVIQLREYHEIISITVSYFFSPNKKLGYALNFFLTTIIIYHFFICWSGLVVECRTRNFQVASSNLTAGHLQATLSNLLANLRCAQVNSASYPSLDGKWVVAYGLQGEGLV